MGGWVGGACFILKLNFIYTLYLGFLSQYNYLFIFTVHAPGFDSWDMDGGGDVYWWARLRHVG